MALIYYDGFEGYSTVADAEGKGIISDVHRDVWSLQTGRNGGKCLQFHANNVYDGIFTCNIPVISEDYSAILGFAVKFADHFEAVNVANDAFLKFGLDNLFAFFRLNNDANGNFTGGFYADSEWKDPFTFTLNVDQWYYMEIKVKFDPTNGSGQFRLDEQLLYNYTGDNVTASNVSPPYDVDYAVLIVGYDYQTAEHNVQFDDIYIADSSGSTFNDFLGDIRIDAIHPNGAGNYAQLTPSAGNNYECIDEVGADESDYVEGAVVGNKDSYSYANVPTDLDDTAIHAVQIRNFAKRTATANNRKLDPFIRTGSTDYSQTEQSMPDAFGEVRGDIVEKDPSDNGDWTQAKINACEFGLEVK